MTSHTPQPAGTPRSRPGTPRGVRIAGSGSYAPDRRLTNADLERMMDTSDEWIFQRTGIRERRLVDRSKGECTLTLSTAALKNALRDSGVAAPEVDLLIVATVCPEMACPSTACRVADAVGMGTGAAFDITAACCGFVYGLNLAHDLIRVGTHRTVAVIGAETLSQFMEYTTEGRGTAILFGDAAGAVVLRATDDPSLGVIAQSTHAQGSGWKDLYIPRDLTRDIPPGADPAAHKPGIMYMNGREVFKFAVTTFQGLIAETLDKAGLTPDDVDQFVCHQSNARILEAARERFGIAPEKLYVNIDRYGNTSSASVPLCFDELRKSGRVREGQKVMFVAFGGGLTWASSLWQL
jgi:3-oxoacyl-[acyl-carrier-protein] synthase-3